MCISKWFLFKKKKKKERERERIIQYFENNKSFVYKQKSKEKLKILFSCYFLHFFIKCDPNQTVLSCISNSYII